VNAESQIRFEFIFLRVPRSEQGTISSRRGSLRSGSQNGSSFNLIVTDGAWGLSDFGKLFAGEVVLASPCSDHGQIRFFLVVRNASDNAIPRMDD
jgi:hypothetical protein